VNESKLVNGVDIRNGLDESVMASPERTLLPPPPVNSPATAIPGWFNVAGNGDGWPGAGARNSSSAGNSGGSSSSKGDGNTTRSSDRADDGDAETEASVPSANSGAVPMQNGTKRLKTHHVSSAPAVSESGDSSSETVSTSTAVTTTTAAVTTGASAAVEDNTEDVSSDSVSSEASEASCEYYYACETCTIVIACGSKKYSYDYQ
jgi:hypothetical protein